MKRPADALKQLLGVLDRLEIPYLIGGSMASSIYGIARPTMDVDLVAGLRVDHVDEFADRLKADFYCDPDMIREALDRRRPFNLIHFASSLKFDIFPALDDDFSRSQMNRRRYGHTNSLGEPIECAIATVEDTILSKLRWFRDGGETSERQWNDLRGILKVSGAVLDLDYLRTWAPKIGVGDLLDRLLEQPPSGSDARV